MTGTQEDRNALRDIYTGLSLGLIALGGDVVYMATSHHPNKIIAAGLGIMGLGLAGSSSVYLYDLYRESKKSTDSE